MTSAVDQHFNMFSVRQETEEFARYTDAPHNASFGPMDLGLAPDALGFQRLEHENIYSIPTSMGFETPMYADASHFPMGHNNNGSTSPGLYTEDAEFRLPSSSMSTASAPSSAIGSPQSNSGQNNGHEWGRGHSAQPSIVGNDYITNGEYGYGGGLEGLAFEFAAPVKAYVDPSLIHPEINNRPSPLGAPHYEAPYHPHTNTHFPVSPSAAASSPQLQGLRTHSSSPPFIPHAPFQSHHAPFPNSPYTAPMDPSGRRPSIGSSFISPTSGEYASGDENKEKQRCTYPDCGKVFKDLKAHMLTHQNERPEKCPIVTCEYHTKGFARKYDKNRHTLTHYKGTMVCGFCPGSGSPAEKSFNRADVFKRHLTSVHGVEQTPPNSRKKPPTGASTGQMLAGYAPDATGKCSTCSQTFSNAQDFYEHLDDCVLRIVQQEDPCEAVNAQRLAEVEDDEEVRKTMELNNLPHKTSTTMEETDEEDEDFDMGEVEDKVIKGRRSGLTKKKGNPPNGVQKSKGMTHSRGGVVLSKNKRRRNQDLPDAWGRHQVKHLKKRVLCVFDGPRRLAKDDMMLAADQEVRIKLADGESYVTDLDVQTLKRAEGFLSASEAEKGPWVSDDPTDAQKREMLEIQRRKDAQALKELEESLTVK